MTLPSGMKDDLTSSSTTTTSGESSDMPEQSSSTPPEDAPPEKVSNNDRFEKLPRSGNLLNLRGHKFGKLQVLRLTPQRHSKKRMWLCKCDCGEELVVRHDYLLHPKNPKTHCGCENRGLPTLYPSEYHIHNSMLRRCYVKDHVGYPDYGGRGISVCERWREPEGKGFENFLADVGKRPSKKHSLDRRNPDGNYEPANCKWATLSEQARNKRKSIFLPHPKFGHLVPAAEIAEYLGITYQAMRARYIKDGLWPTTEGIEN